MRGAAGFAIGSAVSIGLAAACFLVADEAIVSGVGIVAPGLLSSVSLTVGMTLAAACMRGRGFGLRTLVGALPFGLAFGISFGALLLPSAAFFVSKSFGTAATFLQFAVPGLVGSPLLCRYLRGQGAHLGSVMISGFVGFGLGGFAVPVFMVAGRLLGTAGVLVGMALGFVAAFAVGGFVLGLAIDRFREKTVAAHPNGRPY
jgi:hypothetical protein